MRKGSEKIYVSRDVWVRGSTIVQCALVQQTNKKTCITNHRCVGVFPICLSNRVQHLTRLSKTTSQDKSPRWQVDKEAIVLSRVQQLFIYVYPAFLRYLSIVCLIFTLVTFTRYVDNQLHPFINLCTSLYPIYTDPSLMLLRVL